MSEHPKECAWHVDQYPWECTCGLVYRQHRDRIEQLTAEVERLRLALGLIAIFGPEAVAGLANQALAGDSHD